MTRDFITIDDFPDDAWLPIAGWDQGDSSQIAAIRGIVGFINATPEPSTLAPLGTAGLFVVRRRRR